MAERVGAQIAGATANGELYAEVKRADKALRQSETRFRELFDNAPLGYHEVDVEGRITRVNQTELDMLGYSAEEMLGHHVWEFIVERDISRQAVAAKLAGKLPRGRGFERTFWRRDGTTVPVSIEDLTFTDDDGRITGIRSNLQDITERKRLEGLLIQSQKMQAVGQLAGGIAHDFNNLLTPIIGYAELAFATLSEASPLRAYISEIQKAGERASTLTRQLLAFSRRQIVEPRVLNLNDMIVDTDKMLRRLITEHIDLVTVPAPDLGSVKVDLGQMEQVLVNLVVNARDAMPDGGCLTVETSNVTLDAEYARRHPEATDGEHVVLAVTDTGTGMTDQVSAHVFEPFFTTKDVGKGTGLGLSTCYGIVAQSGGHITFETEPGKGTTFQVYLPRAEEESASSSVGDDASSLPVGSETVLLLEDEPLVREVASQALKRQGYTVLGIFKRA